MEPDFWRARWRDNQIGFHQSAATPALVRHLGRAPRPPARVLVPLAGKSHDLAYLAEAGYPVVAVELVESALTAFFAEHDRTPAVERVEPNHVIFRDPPIEAHAIDLFRADATVLGPIDWIFDRAALVAFPEPTRARYASHLRSLLRPGGQILLMSFEFQAPEVVGPPFSVSRSEIDQLYPEAAIEELGSEPLPIENPRQIERGVTGLIERTLLITMR